MHLTNKEPICSDALATAATAVVAGAPEEIKVTREMIEAGMYEYGGRWCGLRDADDDVAGEMLKAAFLAMFAVLKAQTREVGQSNSLDS